MKAPASPLTPPVKTDAVLALLFDLKSDVDRPVLHVLLDLRILLRLQRFEVLQLIQAQQAELPQVAVVNLAFFQRQLAANDLIAGRRVALELDTADIKLFALVQIDAQARSVRFSSSASVFGTGVKLM